MDKNLSLVHSPEHKNYRKMAQAHYGLSDEQMKGVHVHHNPRKADGGRNVPEHLYVYSVENHDQVHGGDGFVSVAAEGGRRGGLSNTASQKKARSKNGKENIQKNLYSPEFSETRKRNGDLAAINNSGCIRNSQVLEKIVREKKGAMSLEVKSQNGKNIPKEVKSRNGKNNAPKTNSQRWECLVTGHVSTPGGLSLFQKSRGIDTKLRKRIK